MTMIELSLFEDFQRLVKARLKLSDFFGGSGLGRIRGGLR